MAKDLNFRTVQLKRELNTMELIEELRTHLRQDDDAPLPPTYYVVHYAVRETLSRLKQETSQ